MIPEKARKYAGRFLENVWQNAGDGRSIVASALRPDAKDLESAKQFSDRMENLQKNLAQAKKIGDAAQVQAAEEAIEKARVDLAGKRTGRVVGDWAFDGTRSKWWLINAAQAIAGGAGRWALQSEGFGPRAAGLGGAGLTLGLEMISGNVDLTNLMEAGRPKGYGALFPQINSEVDPETGEIVETIDYTKSTNPAAELATRYFLNRTGRILPEDQFLAERPDVTPEEYARFIAAKRNNTFFGLEEAPLRATVPIGAIAGMATAALTGKPRFAGAVAGGAIAPLAKQIAIDVPVEMGIIHGTTETPDDPVGEIEFLGYRVPIKAIAATAAGVAALKYGGRAIRDRGNIAEQMTLGTDGFGLERVPNRVTDGQYVTPPPSSRRTGPTTIYPEEQQMRLDLGLPGQVLPSEPTVPSRGIGPASSSNSSSLAGGKRLPSGRIVRPTVVDHPYSPEELAEIRRKRDPFRQGLDGPWIEYR